MNQAEVKRRQAQALSEILGWINLLIIGRVIGCNGAAYLAVAAEAALFVWILAGGGLADTLGRLLRSRNNKGQYRNAERMRNSALLFQLLPGAAGSLILLVAAQGIAEGLLGMRYSSMILMVLSPAAALRTVTCVFLGYFQGEGSEFPTALSGVLRQILICGLGLLFAALLKDYGAKVSGLLAQDNFSAVYGGIGIALAAVAAEVIVLLFLFVIYKGSRRRARKPRQENGMRTVDSAVDCVRHLCSRRWQDIVLGLLLWLPFPLGWIFYGKAVKEEDIAAAEYGMYAGGYVPVCALLAAVAVIVTLPAAGRALALFRKEEQRSARAVFQSGLHMNAVHGIYAAVYAAALGGHLAAALSPEGGETLKKLLQGGSSMVLFVSLAAYFARALINMDRKYPLMAAMAVSDVLFAVSSALFLNTGKTGILALMYAGLTAGCVLCVMLGVLVCGQLRIKPDWPRLLLLPLAAGGLAAVVCVLLEKLLAPHMGSVVTLIVTLAVSAAVYWAALLLARDFREQELEHAPGGRILAALGQMLRVF